MTRIISALIVLSLASPALAMPKGFSARGIAQAPAAPSAAAQP